MKTRFLLLAAGFLGCIVAANYVTTRYGFVSVGLGESATAGTYFAGLAFVLRDSLQDTAGKRAVGATIAAGAVLSLVLALTVYRADATFLPPGVTPTSIALASGLACLLSETADLLVYTPLRHRGYIRAAVASNVVGAVVDTFLFLWVAGFPVWSSVPGQLVGKLTITLTVVLLVGAARAVLRQPVRV